MEKNTPDVDSGLNDSTKTQLIWAIEWPGVRNGHKEDHLINQCMAESMLSHAV